ncbi:uncharacterized protein V1516DRAFT_667256 [Lipomyces oligophaga]|uniref:uncharacterized protein n=1 Tax=Lipomyces oligophaga TaxID=45792 RepID=UPI0034CE37B1
MSEAVTKSIPAVEESAEPKYTSIASSFTNTITTKSVDPSANPTTVTSNTTASETEISSTVEQEKSENLLKELQRAADRVKRFGGDASELESTIKRAEKFGTDALSVRKVVGALDRPLADREERRGRGRGRGVGYGYGSRGQRRGRGARIGHGQGSRHEPYQRKDQDSIISNRPTLTDEEKTKLAKRAERFGN